MTKEYKNVLIARFSALGDVAMTVPVVYSACEAYPTVRFVIATQPVASSLFVNPPQNLTVVGVDVKQRYKGTHGIWRLMGDLRREYAIDAFIDASRRDPHPHHGRLLPYARHPDEPH